MNTPTARGAEEHIDLAQCKYYAEFASHLERWQFDFLYWILFGCNILLLSFVSWWYGRTNEKVKDLDSGDREFIRVHQRCLYVSIGCAVVSVVTVVMEVFALLALQFCDGEDLMSLYWSTWAMLQFGSVIAIFGIILHVALVLQGHDRPPWALALGTPVLVVAGVGNLINSVLHRKTTRVIEKTMSAHPRRGSGGRSRSVSRSRTLTMSQAPTIRPESPENGMDDTLSCDAKVVGTALDGGVILQFSARVPELESRGRLLCCGTDGDVLVSFGRDRVSIIDRLSALEATTVLEGVRPPPRLAREEHDRYGHYRRKTSGCSPYDLPDLPAMSSLKLDLPSSSCPSSTASSRPATADESARSTVLGERPSQISILEPPRRRENIN